MIAVQAAGAEQSYNDPAGDAGPGMDITNVTVRSDTAATVTFRITVSPILANHFVSFLFDADKNASTGSSGVDYGLAAVPGSAFGILVRWDGTSFVQVPTAPVRIGVAGNVVEIEVRRSDLGNTTGFAFLVGSSDVNTVYDNVPDLGFLAYDVPACANGVDDDRDGRVDHPADTGCSGTEDADETDPPLRLTAGKATAVGAPRPTRAFVVIMTVTRSDGRPFAGKVTCTARVGAARLRALGSRAAGRARCTMRIPAGSSGKTVRGTVTAQVESARVTRAFGFRIR